MMAKPIADSAAAIVKTNTTKIWPTKSFKYIESAAKFKFTPKSSNSIDIKIVKMFLRFRITPNNPMKNTVAVKLNI